MQKPKRNWTGLLLSRFSLVVWNRALAVGESLERVKDTKKLGHYFDDELPRPRRINHDWKVTFDLKRLRYFLRDANRERIPRLRDSSPSLQAEKPFAFNFTLHFLHCLLGEILGTTVGTHLCPLHPEIDPEEFHLSKTALEPSTALALDAGILLIR